MMILKKIGGRDKRSFQKGILRTEALRPFGPDARRILRHGAGRRVIEHQVEIAHAEDSVDFRDIEFTVLWLRDLVGMWKSLHVRPSALPGGSFARNFVAAALSWLTTAEGIRA